MEHIATCVARRARNARGQPGAATAAARPMFRSRCAEFLRLMAYPLALWFGLGSLPLACADGIYIYTSGDGAITLSNVPTDSKYTVMLAAPHEPPAAPEMDAICEPVSCPPQYGQIIQDAARANGLDSALIHAVITVESQYNPKARSKKGAVGLMQLMPGIANRYGVLDLYDPAQNIQGGAKYLHDLLALFNGDIELALAAYNAGELAVARYGNRIPPFRETSKYVPRVLRFYQKYRARQPH